MRFAGAGLAIGQDRGIWSLHRGVDLEWQKSHTPCRNSRPKLLGGPFSGGCIETLCTWLGYSSGNFDNCYHFWHGLKMLKSWLNTSKHDSRNTSFHPFLVLLTNFSNGGKYFWDLFYSRNSKPLIQEYKRPGGPEKRCRFCHRLEHCGSSQIWFHFLFVGTIWPLLMKKTCWGW